MGDYHRPIGRLLRDLLPGAEICPAPPITQKTLDLGGRCSPDFVCSPFKYNMGNYIEALEGGANLLLQTGMGCRYGYYGPVQEQILRDLGYRFDFLCLARDRARPGAAYQSFRRLNPNLGRAAFARAVAMAAWRIRLMDRLDFILRQRVGFQAAPGELEAEKEKMLDALTECGSLAGMQGIYRRCRALYLEAASPPPDALRVGVVGELFTLMEPFSNHFLEHQLARMGIAVSRRMNVTFLLFGKPDGLTLRQTGGYLRYTVGANGVDSVAQCRQYAKAGYDGILHLKSFGCTPELNAQPALMRLGHAWGIPILHMSFDTQTGAAGVETRLEAFADMIMMKRAQADERSGQPGCGRGLHLHQGRFG